MEFTQEEFEEAEQRRRENVARDHRYKKEEDALDAQRAAVIARMEALREDLHEIDRKKAETRQNRRENEAIGFDIHIPSRWQGYDTEPEGEEIGDITVWSRDLRRRAWSAAFSGVAFDGKKGTTDLTLFLSLGHLMEIQGTRIIEANIPEIVRVSAMDYKTVNSHMKFLRADGHLLRTAIHSYILVAEHLPALAECPELPSSSLAQRLIMGDRCHDAFGGRHGISPTEIRVWVWLLLNPGVTRYAIAKGAGVGGRAYETLKVLKKRGLVKICEEEEKGSCYALGADRFARVWLEQHAASRDLYGAVTKRVDRAIQPQHHRSRKAQDCPTENPLMVDTESRIIDRPELDMTDWEMPSED